MPRHPAPLIAGILAALLLLFGAYMGAYHLMLEDRVQKHGYGEPSGFHPLYRAHSTTEESFFCPAHQLDRLIRPGYWGGK